MAAPARRIIRVIVFVLLIGAGIVSFALSRTNTAPPFPLGVMRVGVDPTDPPFAFINSEGELGGIDIDIAGALGEAIGVPVEFVLLGYDGLYDALLSERVDILLAALVIDPLRRDRVHYTEPYFNSGLVLISPQTAPLTSMEQITAKRLAVAYGTDAHSEANRWQRRLSAFTRLDYETSAIALDAVRLGDAEGALVDAVTARLYLGDHPNWLTQSVEVTVTPIAIAVRADAGALRAVVSRTTDELLQNGTVEVIIARHLDRPRTTTAEAH